jgi:thymidylate synthase
MSGIPVLSVEGDCIARAWENSLVALHREGFTLNTQYDKPGDPPSRDATMVVTVHDPLAEPMIHRDFPGGFEELQEYVMEVCDGIKDHLVRDPADPHDTRWEYTYHQRLFRYEVPTIGPIDQIEHVAEQLAKTPHTRRAQAITWKVWEDRSCDDPACLQSVWCRITGGELGENRPSQPHSLNSQPPTANPQLLLNMNVRFRSNDAYKAAMMNMFALVQLQRRIAGRVAEVSGRPIGLGRYCHIADSYHIYGFNLKEFEARFLGAMERRTFEQRTIRYEDVRDIMEAARPQILEKARAMGRSQRMRKEGSRD